MFSGIIEKLAPVVSFERRRRKVARLRLDLGTLARGLRLGDSVAVNGVCLTVTGIRKRIITFEVIAETLRLTNLGGLVEGAVVNVEWPLSLGDRIDGHLVTGHIDGTGRISGRRRLRDGSIMMVVRTGRTLTSMMVPKGSVAVDGISLTLVRVAGDSFSVCLIPRTLSVTTLGRRGIGDSVNLEVDQIAKYVRKFA